MNQNKRNRKQRQLLKELEDNPLIERACKKVGIARSTYYRWIESSPAFSVEADEAQTKGRAKLTDYVESKLIENIGMNQHSSIAFWLSHNTTRYRTYTHRAYAEELNRLKRIELTLNELSDLLLDQPDGYQSVLRLAERAKAEVNRGSNNNFNKV